jgi:hypothetical protein
VTSVIQAQAAVNASILAIEQRLRASSDGDEQGKLRAAYSRLWIILGQLEEAIMEQAAAAVSVAAMRLEQIVLSANTSPFAEYKVALDRALVGIGVNVAPYTPATVSPPLAQKTVAPSSPQPQPGAQPQPGFANADDGSVWWKDLVLYYASFKGIPDGLKVASLSQWILESGRGTSRLAREHRNFAGIKFRERMAGHATPVDYTGTDGDATTYCSFDSIAAFVAGYWHFIRSGPYDGWDQLGDDGVKYIRHIASNYAANPAYVGKVLALFDEAAGLLRITLGTASISAGGTPDNAARLAVVVGHNRLSKGASSGAPINQMEFDFNQIVAEEMKSEAGHYNLNVELFWREATGSYSKEIQDAYAKVASWNPHCILELHFNSSSDAQANGLEMLCLSNEQAKSLAAKLVVSTTDLLKIAVRHADGLRLLKVGDRGWGSVSALPNIPTVLCEPFFGSNSNDCVAAATVGREAIGRAYLRGVRDWLEGQALDA